MEATTSLRARMDAAAKKIQRDSAEWKTLIRFLWDDGTDADELGRLAQAAGLDKNDLGELRSQIGMGRDAREVSKSAPGTLKQWAKLETAMASLRERFGKAGSDDDRDAIAVQIDALEREARRLGPDAARARSALALMDALKTEGIVE